MNDKRSGYTGNTWEQEAVEKAVRGGLYAARAVARCAVVCMSRDVVEEGSKERSGSKRGRRSTYAVALGLIAEVGRRNGVGWSNVNERTG